MTSRSKTCLSQPSGPLASWLRLCSGLTRSMRSPLCFFPTSPAWHWGSRGAPLTLQSAVAYAEALVGSARSYVFEVLGDLWAALVAGNQPSTGQRARYRLSMTHVHSACVQAVELVYKVGGGSSVYATHPFDRHFRDIHTINQHLAVSLKTYEVAGRMLLGLEPGEPFF